MYKIFAFVLLLLMVACVSMVGASPPADSGGNFGELTTPADHTVDQPAAEVIAPAYLTPSPGADTPASQFDLVMSTGAENKQTERQRLHALEYKAARTYTHVQWCNLPASAPTIH